jgi:hypothetical protein
MFTYQWTKSTENHLQLHIIDEDEMSSHHIEQSINATTKVPSLTM